MNYYKMCVLYNLYNLFNLFKCFLGKYGNNGIRTRIFLRVYLFLDYDNINVYYFSFVNVCIQRWFNYF